LYVGRTHAVILPKSLVATGGREAVELKDVSGGSGATGAFVK
jgi:hypothetical protein